MASGTAKAGVPPGRLKEWAAKAGWEKLVNARGPTWRKIPDKEKISLNESKALKLLQQNSSAIRRPIVEAGDRLLVGFDAAEFEKLR
jgi:arsenate reductase (glutaredoxin)